MFPVAGLGQFLPLLGGEIVALLSSLRLAGQGRLDLFLTDR